MHRSSIVYKKKRVQYSSKQICGGSWCETTTGDGLFTIQKALLWIMDSQTCSFWTQLISCYLMDWSGVDYLWIIVMFLSAVWTLILTAPIHCRGCIGEASDGILHFFKSVPWTNKLIYILGWPECEYIFQHIFIFGWSIPLKLWLCSKCFFFLFQKSSDF